MRYLMKIVSAACLCLGHLVTGVEDVLDELALLLGEGLRPGWREGLLERHGEQLHLVVLDEALVPPTILVDLLDLTRPRDPLDEKQVRKFVLSIETCCPTADFRPVSNASRNCSI